MSNMIDKLRENDKKGVFASNDDYVCYPTGLLPLDYAIGFIAKRKVDSGLVDVINLGIMGGTFSTFIGLSGTGKTTLADQIAFNIIRPFKDGVMIHYDVEKTAYKERIIEITGAEHDDQRIILKKEDTSIDDVMGSIGLIAAEKEAGGDRYKYAVDPERLIRNKKPIMAYVPTVIIIDSLPTFTNKDSKVSELEGNMAANREARDISQFYSKQLDIMSKYNITVFAINHIKSKIQVNSFSHTPPQLMMLKQDESLPRGEAPIYLSQNVFRCNATKGNIYKEDDNGFSGFKCVLQIAKTKTAFIGPQLDICFNKHIGFDPIYTIFEFANGSGIIEGRNPHLYFKGLDAFKFSRKEFRNKFINDRAFAKAVLNTLEPYFNLMIDSKKADDAGYIDIASLMDSNESGNEVG